MHSQATNLAGSGWHALRYSEGRAALSESPRPSPRSERALGVRHCWVARLEVLRRAWGASRTPFGVPQGVPPEATDQGIATSRSKTRARDWRMPSRSPTLMKPSNSSTSSGVRALSWFLTASSCMRALSSSEKARRRTCRASSGVSRCPSQTRRKIAVSPFSVVCLVGMENLTIVRHRRCRRCILHLRGVIVHLFPGKLATRHPDADWRWFRLSPPGSHAPRHLLFPTLRVGTRLSTLCVEFAMARGLDAERRQTGSHAERGNQENQEI